MKNNMFFILQFVLIILLNKTYAYITQDIETILLPILNTTNAVEISLNLTVFGKQIQLNLRRNEQIISSTFKVWKHEAKSITEDLSQINASDPCNYFHKDHISIAIINFCQKHGWDGFIFLKNKTLEIRPLRDDFASLSSINDLCVKEEINISFGKPHLIKRSLQLSADTNFHNLDNFKLKRRHVENTEEKLTIELAVFLDEFAYHMFMPFLDNDEKKLRMLILAYVNHIQAVYHYSSLGVSIDISLVYLEIMEKQPTDLPVFDGDDEKLFYSFCNYSKSRNFPDDNDSRHWDVGLYLTAIDLYSTSSEGVLESVGISNSDSVCLIESCALVEFGLADAISSGFTSSLIAAHEIGHVLGMKHDFEYNIPCNAYKYIMAAERLMQGQTMWSNCSREIAEELWYTKPCLRDRTRLEHLDDALDHSHYHNLPGRQWTAKAQCEIFYRDKDANVITSLDICKILQCETFYDEGSFSFTGPALEGTHCALGKECREGECVPVFEPPYIFNYCEDDNWSKWEESPFCLRSCLQKSKGIKIKRRSCKQRGQKSATCGGSYYDVVLCDDTLLCEKREAIDSFSKEKCKQFNEEAQKRNLTYLTLDLATDLKAGWQVSHDIEKPWIACITHCKQKNSILYAPYLKMIDFNIDPYLPDGTWCHNKDSRDYYCRQYYCLPEKDS